MGYKRRDIERASEKAVNIKLRAGAWGVYKDYNLKKTSDGERFVAAQMGARGIVKLGVDVSFFLPLVDRQDLFLEFARLGLEFPGRVSLAAHPSLPERPDLLEEFGLWEWDTEKNASAAVDWARNHGVLGLTPGKPPRRGGDQFSSGGDPRGGEGDTVRRFAFEVATAHETLRLYEAATDRRGVNVDVIWGFLAPPPDGEETSRSARRRALEVVAHVVEAQVRKCCYPTLRQKNDGIVSGWGFKNLLGAMWLQMMWLVTADSGRRCQRPECNKVITIKKPRKEEGLKYRQWERGLRPNHYVTRKDKKYCSNSCRTLASRARKKQNG